MIWIPVGLCGTNPTCYIEGGVNASGVFISFKTLRACAYHIALNGKPALYAALRVEGGLASHVVEALQELEPTKRIVYTFDAIRSLTVTVEGASFNKNELQAAADTAVGVGKVTIV